MDSLKDYLERLAAQPPLAPHGEPAARRSCARCDGEVFFLSATGDAVCAGCGAELKTKD